MYTAQVDTSFLPGRDRFISKIPMQELSIWTIDIIGVYRAGLCVTFNLVVVLADLWVHIGPQVLWY